MRRVDSVIGLGKHVPEFMAEGETNAQADDVRLQQSDLCRGFC